MTSLPKWRRKLLLLNKRKQNRKRAERPVFLSAVLMLEGLQAEIVASVLSEVRYCARAEFLQ